LRGTAPAVLLVAVKIYFRLFFSFEMVIVGCCKQQLQLQGLQNTCSAFQLSSCNVGPMRSRRRSTSSCSDGAGVVVMSLLFRPCCIFSASACKQVRVVNIGCSSNGGGSSSSVRSRRRSSRFVCMVADERNSQRQQQKEQQQQQQQQAQSLLVLQQHKGELLSPVEEDKDVEEEQEEEVMTQRSVFPSSSDAIDFASSVASAAAADATAMADRRSKQRKRERTAYLFAAITSSIGFVTLAAGAVYYRFIWQMQVRILSFLSVSRNARRICAWITFLSLHLLFCDSSGRRIST
jgi:hypothetical protein